MKDNVSLIKKKQKSFSSSVDKYKKLLKKGEIKIEEKPVAKNVVQVKQRGIAYVGNIPHGFYEKEMQAYFKQFGVVTRIRVARSRKTGASKGYAFVEFKEPEVAKIVAETMNNYLMGKRLLKAQYISPEEQVNKDYFKGKNFTAERYPTLVNRKKNKLVVNSSISEEKMMEKNKNAVKNLQKIRNKLKSLGIQYDFKPVDVPSYLSDEVKLLQNNQDNSDSSENSDSESLLSFVEHDSCSNEESSDDIVFTPPEDLASAIKQKLNKKNQKIDKQKLTGVTKKSKAKIAKPTKVKDAKANLIKKQINNKDQIRIKSPKKIKAEKNALKKKSPKK